MLLDKHAHIQTVVNKSSSIDETFRFLKMDLLAGEDRMVATVRENDCSFTLDFSKVYWNSRLHTEHARVIKELKRTDTVLDMFAGVGPFAIPACKKGCLVYANDLNPHAYQALYKNAERNKVSQRMRCFNLDGREFVKKVIGQMIADRPVGHPFPSTHIIMNLPASAVEFLDVFRGMLVGIEADKDNTPLPMLHCYCFTKSSTPKEDCVEQVERMLRGKLETFDIFEVRDVSPNKLMMRVRFALPSDVAYGLGTRRRVCYWLLVLSSFLQDDCSILCSCCVCTNSTDGYQVVFLALFYLPVAGGGDSDEGTPLPKKPCLDEDRLCE